MLIWINGAHGAGKTKVARRLATLRPDTALLDPEQIGFMLRRIWPAGGPPDFQDFPLWRELTLSILKAAAANRAAPRLVVPMTLANPGYFQEIVGGLRAAGVDVRHFTLVASAATLRRRLRWRIDRPASTRWALARIESCSAALQDDAFATHVRTDDRRIDEIAADILARLESRREG